MSRKLLSLLAALLALSLVAAACSNDDDAESADTGPDAAQSEPAPAEEPAEEPVEEPAAEPAEEAEEPEAPGTVVEVAVGSGAFPTLVAAVQAAGLVETLSGPGPFTVFAPTEEAFAAALSALGLTAEELLGDTELLTAVLTYHVLPLAAPAEVVVTLDGQSVATVGGAEVTVTVDGDTVMVNDATVVTVDIEASNGIIHVIDTVLLPPAS
ncbi:fasciclin domain-containing protein [Candidatus Poriferisocius sp.]|uniref:fasciclin domain-containing protein n=1 Tax=Candidatus Poriferisocius sp. TaxID=3101276 RepID=UPI003B58BFE5